MTDAEIFIKVVNWFKKQKPLDWIMVLGMLNLIVLFVVGVLSIFIGTEFIKNEGALVAMTLIAMIFILIVGITSIAEKEGGL